MSKLKEIFDKAFAVDAPEEEAEKKSKQLYAEKKPVKTPLRQANTNNPSTNTNNNLYKGGKMTLSSSDANRDKAYQKPSVVKMNNNSGAKVHTFEPTSLDDAKKVIEYLNSGYAVLLNLENTDTALSQRIVDVVTGALYLLDGDYSVVTEDIYLLAPKGVEISSPLSAENSNDKKAEAAANNNTFSFRK